MRLPYDSGIVLYNNKKMAEVGYSSWVQWILENKREDRDLNDQATLSIAMGKGDIPIALLPWGYNFRLTKPHMQKWCETLNPKPQTLNPKPQTLSPNFSIANPQMCESPNSPNAPLLRQ